MNIPNNLEEAIEELKNMLSTQEQIEIIKMDKGPIMLHHSLGRWLRNNWGLWQENTNLFSYFKQLGLWHADDMSGLILDAFWSHLRNESFDIDAYVKKFQDYWKTQKETQNGS